MTMTAPLSGPGVAELLIELAFDLNVATEVLVTDAAAEDLVEVEEEIVEVDVAEVSTVESEV